MTVEKIRPRTAEEMAATLRKLVCECRDAYCTRRNEVDLLLAKAANAEALRAELALVSDTLRLRTESHGRLLRDRLACPHCSTLPIEETPSE